MPKAGDHIIVFFIDEQVEGFNFERTRNKWPLHITLLPWFSGIPYNELTTSLEKIAKNLQPFELCIGEQVLYGENKNISVNVIANQVEVKQLHEALLNELNKLKGKLDSTRWIGDEFSAHITHHEGSEQHKEAGSLIPMKDFNIVKLGENNTCEIGVRFILGTGL